MECTKAEFPLAGTTSDQLKFSLNYAILAPSGPKTFAAGSSRLQTTRSPYLLASVDLRLPQIQLNRTQEVQLSQWLSQIMLSGGNWKS
jgi:hypothetical protein